MRRFLAPFVALALAAAPSVAQTNSGFSFSFPVQTTTTLKLALTVNGSPYDLNAYLASGGSAMFQMVWATGSGTVHIVNASSVGVNSGDPTNVASIVITSSQVSDTAKWAATFVAGNQTWTGTVLTLPFGSAASATTNGVVTAAAPPPASTTAVGGILLSGDLSGTATVPQVVASHLAAPLPQGQGGSGAATLGAGTITATGESTARALADKLSDVISVKGFPGVSCNGINDDAAGLASAGTAANTAGASLLVNCKVRIASAAGTVSAPLKFEGSGALDLSPVGGSVTITGALLAPTKQIFFTGSGTLTFSAKVAQVVPQWWGAVGDGATDDTAAIQAALNLSSQRVYFPCGTYKETGLTVAAGSTLTVAGAARECVTLTYAGTGYAITAGTSAADTTNVGVEKLSINVSTGTGAGCISFVRTEGGFLRDLYCQGATSGTDSGTAYNLIGTGNYVGNIVVDRVRANGNFTVGFDNNGAVGINTCNHIDYRQVSIARTTAKPGTGTIGFRWGVNCGDGALLIPDVEGYDIAYEVDGRFLMGVARAENNTTALNFGASSFDNMITVQGFTNTNNVTGIGGGGTFNTAMDPVGFGYTVNNGAADGALALNETNDHKVTLSFKAGNTAEQQEKIDFLNKASGLVFRFYKSTINDIFWEDGSGNQILRVASGNPSILLPSTRNNGQCTLNGASPAVCTATVTLGSKCVAVPQGTTATAATHTLATSVTTNTLTVTGANALTDVVTYHCF